MRLWRGSKTGLGWSPASLPVEGVRLGDGARRLLTMAPSLLPSNAIVDDERTGWRSGKEGEREPKFKNPVASRSSVRQPLATSNVRWHERCTSWKGHTVAGFVEFVHYTASACACLQRTRQDPIGKHEGTY